MGGAREREGVFVCVCACVSTRAYVAVRGCAWVFVREGVRN